MPRDARLRKKYKMPGGVFIICVQEKQKRLLPPNASIWIKACFSQRSNVKISFNKLLPVSVESEHAMTDKQLINSPENCVEESLRGFSKLHPNLYVDFERKIVSDAKCCLGGRVALISGGGSGHEPFPAGFVGEGMLAASVSGPVFTSPPSRNILHAIRLAATGSSGVLLLVPNYTGDVLNFGLAAESALAEGIKVESIIVGEDAAQEVEGVANKAGKRGMCGLVLACKIAGHLAQRGCDVAEVKRVSAEAVRSMASMGLCVSACCKPGVGPLFDLAEDEMEVGVGVHGEAGIARVKMMSAREAVEVLLQFVLPSLKAAEGDEVVALLNNLGSLSRIEEWLLAGELEERLSERKINVLKLYSGCFFTSLNMAGVQICVLKLNPETKETILAALDNPTTASAWGNPARRSPRAENVFLIPAQRKKVSPKGLRTTQETALFLKRCFIKISEELTKQEGYLNSLDSTCGDGDCGTSFRRVANLLKASAECSDFTDPIALFSDLSSAIEESIGGTTGALYGLFLKGCVAQLLKFESINNPLVIPECWRAGVEAIKKYSSARIGDRTMLDSLETGCQALESHLEQKSTLKDAFKSALNAAVEGCEGTKFLKALAGRASYVDQSKQKDVDAGAYAVTLWLSAILCVSDEE